MGILHSQEYFSDYFQIERNMIVSIHCVFNYEPNGTKFGPQPKGKLLLQSYSYQFTGNCIQEKQISTLYQIGWNMLVLKISWLFPKSNKPEN